MIAAISYEKGQEYCEIYDKSIDIVKFMRYIRNLRSKNKGDKIFLYIDNLNIHRSKKVQRLLR